MLYSELNPIHPDHVHVILIFCTYSVGQAINCPAPLNPPGFLGGVRRGRMYVMSFFLKKLKNYSSGVAERRCGLDCTKGMMIVVI